MYIFGRRRKWGVMGGSRGGETAALHPALLPLHVLALLIFTILTLYSFIHYLKYDILVELCFNHFCYHNLS